MSPASHKPIVVTGAAGFIGSNLALELHRRATHPLILVDRDDAPGRHRIVAACGKAEFMDLHTFRDDIRRRAFESAAAVIHLGACSSTLETDEAFLADNNTRYTEELCTWCLDTGTRFIYASSAAVYGDGSLGYDDDESLTARLTPLNAYGRSKHHFDLWALRTGAAHRIAGLRYFNVYGPGEEHKGPMQSVVRKAYDQVLNDGELSLFRSYRPEYRDGEQVRDFVYVRDAVLVTLFFLDHPRINGIYNCGTGQERTWLDLGRAVFRALNREPRIRFIDMPPALRDQYQYHTRARLDRLNAAGCMHPFTPLETGVQEYVQWLNEQTDRPAGQAPR
ncbi:MAG: ADP-glyceromanno-heptose 6-epimerase [Lentisphaerae bacterium RIFOXYA12_FULL_60_10]|nr:MAG: ADP-glyceromanno-heptose 6-epimerase [Lentisphaerae bacterium RIFOXYA12_FULL_60_10]